MKKEINGSETVYLISLFCMPIITFISVSYLLRNIMNLSDTLAINKYDLSFVYTREIGLFMCCWILLFMTYIFHKLGWKLGQIGVVVLSITILLYSILLAINTITSIANMTNPIIVASSAIYGLMKPLPEKTVRRRKERVKNSLEKYKPTKKKTKSNKK